MKKIKSLFCMLVLSTCLVGNVFAGDTAGFGVFSFFDSVINAVVTYISAPDDCPPRQCQNCKPKEEGGNGNCRPND